MPALSMTLPRPGFKPELSLISRRTIFVLLFSLLLAAGLCVWSAQQHDECSAFLGGDRQAPASQVVRTGTRTILVPCHDWLVRQSMQVQLLCGLTAAGFGVFLVSLWADRKREMKPW